MAAAGYRNWRNLAADIIVWEYFLGLRESAEAVCVLLE